MPVKIKKYAVAFLNPNGEIVHHDVDVIGVDRLRGEMEARRVGVRGQSANAQARGNSVDITDMGDMLNREALDLWAACVRLEHYDKASGEWRTKDFVGSEEIKDVDGDPVEADMDPTQSAASTGGV